MPDVDLVPLSEPFAEAAELAIAPARTELREYIEDTDARFEASVLAICGLAVESGVGLAKSNVLLAESLGVSESSTAYSSRGLGVPSEIE